MGKIIRRTVTITITETWTIVWTTDGESQRQAMTMVPEQPNPQEEPDAAVQTPIRTGTPGASDPTAMPPTPAAANDPQLHGVSAKPEAGSQRKRTRREEG